jgi:hypothetical protein
VPKKASEKADRNAACFGSIFHRFARLIGRLGGGGDTSSLKVSLSLDPTLSSSALLPGFDSSEVEVSDSVRAAKSPASSLAGVSEKTVRLLRRCPTIEPGWEQSLGVFKIYCKKQNSSQRGENISDQTSFIG